MRIGDSRSASYRALKSRQYRRRNEEIEKLCSRLDRLVERAESFKKGKTRKALLEQAEKVREKLRQIDH